MFGIFITWTFVGVAAVVGLIIGAVGGFVIGLFTAPIINSQYE